MFFGALRCARGGGGGGHRDSGIARGHRQGWPAPAAGRAGGLDSGIAWCFALRFTVRAGGLRRGVGGACPCGGHGAHAGDFQFLIGLGHARQNARHFLHRLGADAAVADAQQPLAAARRRAATVAGGGCRLHQLQAGLGVWLGGL